MDFIELKVNIRKQTGNGPARALRREGRFPAVLYGPQTEATLLSVNCHEFEQILKDHQAGQVLLNLVIENDEQTARHAMIRELQADPVSRNLLHVDFYEISMDRKIKVKVPVVTSGKSIGVEMGGMLQLIRRELEVFCLPNEIPETIEIDITNLDIGDSLHVNEIPLTGNVEIPADVNYTVATVLSPKVEEEEVVEEEEELEEEAEEAAEREAAADTGSEE
ncbi:MAG: 50S ribosomal protein L25/general stress protein Ctc [Desulfobacterales bacterium]|nr:50S ribosomal protein L25/general stress protein Ctc [Desulfobacterales bacterium]